jgi:RNAse (barnase) inhibitor barstar
MTPFLRLLLQGDRGRVAASVRFETWHPELLAEFGFGIDVVDFTGVSDKESTMARIAEALELPEWFGRNWDALDETLGDRYCRSPRVLVLNHLEALARADRDTTATLVQVAGDAVAGTGSLVLAVGLPIGSEPGSDPDGQAPE